MRKIIVFIFCIGIFQIAVAQHTFSIVAIDAETGEIGTAGATCLTSADCGGCGGAVIITDIVAGKGGMNSQAQICLPNVNLNRGILRIEEGNTATEVLNDVLKNDLCQFGGTSDRQYGIVTINEGVIDVAGFTGTTNSAFAGNITGPNYAIQGNILIGEEVLTGMEQGFLNTEGTLAEKLMGAMQGAKIPGADSRCLAQGISSRSSFLRLMPLEGESDFRYMNLIIPNTINNVDPIDSLQSLFTERFELISNINELKFGNEVTVFPNPAQDYIILQNEKHSLLNKQIKFFNSQGQSIMQNTITADRIAVKDLPNGVIYYQVFDEHEGQILFGKFLIQR